MSTIKMRIPFAANAGSIAQPTAARRARGLELLPDDSAGYEHVLIALRAGQLETKLASASGVWDRRTGRCLSHRRRRPEVRHVPSQ